MPIRFIRNAFDFIKITTFFGIRLNRMYFFANNRFLVVAILQCREAKEAVRY